MAKGSRIVVKTRLEMKKKWQLRSQESRKAEEESVSVMGLLPVFGTASNRASDGTGEQFD